jgi:ABC-2 type transport system permease protein
MKSLQIQIKREFWEHRALWIAPLAITAVLLTGAALVGNPRLIRIDAADGAPPLLEITLLSWAAPFYLTAIILATMYLLDCLYAERRDRSILFWKSLPVSDTRTVLAKLLVGLVLVPLGTFVLAALTSLLASAILALRLALAGPGAAPLWDSATWLRTQGLMLYTLLAALLWYAPYAAYLMLASAWARRWPSAWAIIPPILLGLFEYMIFGTHYVRQVAQRGFGELMALIFRDRGGAANAGAANAGDAIGHHVMSQYPEPSALFASPQLWLGLAAAALMLVLAIRLRSYRDDS